RRGAHNCIGLRGLRQHGGSEARKDRSGHPVAMADRRNRPGASPGAVGSRRGERGRGRQLPASRRGLRRLPARHRTAQGTGADLEARTSAGRGDGMGASLIDSYGRVHNNLRISVTDRCNLRCTYCMPEDVTFLDKRELLTFEEIAAFTWVAAGLGVDKVRLTGGEPLLRRGLPAPARMTVDVPDVRD